MPRRICFVCKYSPRMASTRYRVLQYRSLFEQHDWSVQVVHLDMDTVTQWHRWQWYWQNYRLARKSVLTLAPPADVFYFHKVIPLWPVLQALKRRKCKIFFDFDDAPFATVNGTLVPEFYRTVIQATAYADAFIVVSDIVRELMVKDSQCPIYVIPTGLEVAEYRGNLTAVQRRLMSASKPVTIGWSGSSGLREFVGSIAGALESIYHQYGDQIQYQMISSGVEQLETKCPVTYRSWTPAIDISHIGEFDIGIMPLPRNFWTESKGGFKILRYIASGIPSIASPIGPNCEIITHEETGLLASSIEEWGLAIKQLLDNPQLRHRLQLNGLEMVMQRYDRSQIYQRLQHLINGC